MLLPDNAVRRTASEYSMDCPNCGKTGNHFYFNVINRKGYCQVCHYGVGWKQFLKDFGLEDTEERIVFIPQEMIRHSERQLLGLVPAWIVGEPRAYLKSRGVAEETARFARLQWHAPTGCLVATMTSVSRTLPPEYMIRKIRSGGKWRPVNHGIRLLEYGYGHEFVYPDQPGIVLYEGLFDLLATQMLGHAIALCGSRLSRGWGLWLSKRYKKVMFWLDPDEAGMEGLRHGSKLLTGLGMEVFWVEGRDPKMLRPDKELNDKNFLESLRKFTVLEYYTFPRRYV